jgi:signal transduction histidine kinase
MYRLVDDFSLLGEGGQRAPSLRPTNLSELVKQAVGRLTLVARQGGLTLATELTNEPHQVPVDAVLIGRAVENLLVNAIKFSPQGGVITVRVKPGEAGMMQVSVTDQGPGLSADKLPRAWERFLHIDSAASRKALNTGLALAVVKQIVEIHGGKVWVESESGKGSTYGFALRKL